MKLRDKFIDVAGTRIRYVQVGSGENLVMLHGWGASLESFRPVIRELSRQYEITALDFPGHGMSDLPPGTWGVADFTHCLEEFMARVGIQKPHIIAHSFGGRVTVNLAATKPQQVNKLVLAGSAGVPSPRSFRHYVKVTLGKIGFAVARLPFLHGSRLHQYVFDKVASPDYKAAGSLRPTFVRVIGEDLRDRMPNVKAPTLLIWGENDQETPVSSGKIMHDLIPHSELVVLQNAGHYVFLDQTMQFILRVKRFLNE